MHDATPPIYTQLTLARSCHWRLIGDDCITFDFERIAHRPGMAKHPGLRHWRIGMELFSG